MPEEKRLMKTLGRIFVFLAILIALVAALGMWALFRSGYGARREKPSQMETGVARHARHMMTPSSAVSMKNPYPVTPQRIAEGREHWTDHCAQCHGLDGGGDTDIGRNLYPPVPDMRKADSQDLSDGELFYIIQNGVMFTGMPGWGGKHNAEETWHLVQFIRHLPQLTSEELKQMQQKAPHEPEAGDHHPEPHH
jgi:mono/diheme cytochrome c family protein